MGTVMERFSDWIQSHMLIWQFLGTISLILLVVTLVALPIVIIKLPDDYFSREKREPARRARKHPLFWGVVTVLKNLLGMVLILAGIAMLVLPGQGVLTILIGLAISNFPGKYALERRIAGRPAVEKALNRIRRVAGRPPLVMPEDTPERSHSEA
jgi:hypothetical protein